MSDEDYQLHHCDECGATHILVSLKIEEAITIRTNLEESIDIWKQARTDEDLSEKDIDEIDDYITHMQGILNQLPSIQRLEEIEKEDAERDKSYGVQ